LNAWTLAAGVGLFVWILMRFFIQLAPSMGLLACSGGHREHSQPTPMVGGIAISIALLAALLSLGVFLGLGLGIFILLVAGVIDDRFEISHFWRFAVQILAAWVIVYIDDVRLVYLGELYPGVNLYVG
jgi:UDP-GlcNAc:undecaprenyl-phosphate/decaprenyl-phosphate GlcNAc-1-phosphate transferase